MDKALEMGKTSATGSVKLFIGRAVYTIVLGFGTIVLGLFIRQADYGLYTVAFIPVTAFLLFQDWGIGYAMVKFCAQCRAKNNNEGLRSLIITGLSFSIVTGTALTLLCFALSSFLASTVFNKPETAFLIALASVNILLLALLNISQNFFVGFERMEFYSYALICQAAIQAVSAPLLVYLGYGALGAAVSYTLASASACALSLIFLYKSIYAKMPSNEEKKASRYNLKTLLKYGVPLAVSGIMSGGLSQFTNFIIASFFNSALIGNFRIAVNFSVLLTFFTIPITTVLFPAFSKLDPRNEGAVLKSVFTSSVKYAAVFLMPVTLAVIVFSHPLIYTIYGAKWPFAPNLLAANIIGNLFVILGSLSVTIFLQGVGETKLVLKLNLLSLLIGAPISYVVAREFGLYWMLIASALTGLPSFLLAIQFIRKRYDATIDFQASIRILVASLVVAAVSYLLVSALTVSEWLKLAVGIVVFLILYLISLPLSGAVNQTDVDDLRGMFHGLGPARKVLELLLRVPETILNAISKIRRRG